MSRSKTVLCQNTFLNKINVCMSQLQNAVTPYVHKNYFHLNTEKLFLLLNVFNLDVSRFTTIIHRLFCGYTYQIFCLFYIRDNFCAFKFTFLHIKSISEDTQEMAQLLHEHTPPGVPNEGELRNK